MIDPNALKTELTTDPMGLGFAPLISAGNDQGCADLLNKKQFAGKAPLPSTELLAWSGQNGRYVGIQEAANATLPATTDPSYANAKELKSVANTAQDLIRRDNTSLDLNLQDRQQMLSALVSGGVITQADSDSLYSLAATQISRAEVLWGVGTSVSNGDVSFALRGNK